MRMRRIVLAAALACAAPATAAAAQAAQAGAADSAWVNLVSMTRLRDELAGQPAEARLHHAHAVIWERIGWRVTFPEPFRSRAFVAESHVLLDVDSAGHAAGCRPLRAGTHAELDAFACTLLMRPGYFTATIPPPAPQPRESQAGRWVLGLRWEGLTAAAHRQRESSFSGTGTYQMSPVPPRRQSPPPRRMIRGEVAESDYRRIADQRMTEGRVEATLAIDERGVPTGCRVAHSSGNPAIDERTCALLVDRVRFTQRVDSSGTAIADSFSLAIDVDRMLASRPPLAQPIEIGQTVSGRLESGDRVSANGTFYDEYTVTAPGATGIRITLHSAELGPSLRATFDKPPYRLGEGRSHSSGGRDLEVSVDVPAGARVRIQAGAMSRGMQGAYTLQVTAIQPGSPLGDTAQR